MSYDVGKVTKDVQSRLLGSPPERVPTVAELRGLLKSLRALTDKLEDATNTWADGFVEGVAGVAAPDPELVTQTQRDLKKWKERLAGYSSIIAGAESDAKETVLWTVTAPLVLGLYGGPSSDEPRLIPDFVTPFIISNVLELEEQLEQEEWSRFLADLVRPIVVAGSAGSTLIQLAIVGGVVFVAAKLVSKWRGR